MTKEERRVCLRAKTIMSKLIELQDIERQTGTSLLPSSTEGFVQDIEDIAMEVERCSQHLQTRPNRNFHYGLPMSSYMQNRG